MDEPKQKQTNGMPWWLVLIIVVLVSGLATGGTWYFMNTKIQDKASVIDGLNRDIAKLKITPTASVTPTPTPSVVAENIPSYATNWYKYENTQYGFSFRYPREAGWPAVANRGSGKKACANPLVPRNESANGLITLGFGNFYSVSIIPNPNNLTVSQYITQNNLINEQYSSITINHYSNTIDGGMIINKNATGIQALPGYNLNLAFYRDSNNIYKINAFQNYGSADNCAPEDATANINTLGDILETFHFTHV